MRILLAVSALPLALVLWLHHVNAATEGELVPIASGVAGHRLEVDCQSYWGSLLDAQAREGEVRFDANGVPEPRIFLTHSTCMTLRDFSGHSHHAALECLRTNGPPRPGDDCYRSASRIVYAILVLAHEAYHTMGVTSESAANCYAIQSMAWTAAELGAAEDEAVLIASAMVALEPLQGGEYGTSECVPGAALDLHPETDAFPTESPLAPAGAIRANP